MTGDEKPIVDLTLMRKDVLDFMAEFDKVQETNIQTYLKQNPPESIDMQDLGMRIYTGNRQWILERNVPKSLFSQDEMLFIARMGRYDMDISGEKIPGRPIPSDTSIESIMIGTIPAEWQKTPGVSDKSVILYFHGGAFTVGSPKSHRGLTIDIGRATAMKVLSVDYRLSPEHPYPAAIEDALTVYYWLLDEGYDSSKIVIAGDSAGGYLTLSVLLRLRDEGKPLPAAGVCLAPVTDMTFSHDSFFTNAKTDPMIAPGGVFWMIEAYLGDADPNDRNVSPLFAELEGLPPLLFQASKIEMVYSDSERFIKKAKAAGVDVTFQTWDDMVHVFQSFNLPETYKAIDMIGDFVKNKMG